MAKKKNAENVSLGTPKAGGALFIAPAGTPLPTDAATELPEQYACLGCVTEDGYVLTPEADSEDIKDSEGDVVATSESKRAWSFKTTMMEHLNPDVLKVVFGEDQVTVAEDGSIAITYDALTMDEYVMVLDSILKGGRIDRLVMPRAKVAELGDVNRRKNEAIQYETTLKLLTDADGKPAYEYISAPKGASAAKAAPAKAGN